MKICLITNLYKPYNRGGAERVVEMLNTGFTEAGYKVLVISTKPLKDTSNKLQDINKYQIQNTKYKILSFYPWNMISYNNLHKLFKPLRLVWHALNIFNIQSYFKIKSILKREKPDLVITHNLMGVGFLTPFAIKAHNIKHIHTLHDIQLLHPSGLMNVGEEQKVDSVFAKIYQAVNKKLFSKVDAVVSPSEWLLEMHQARGLFEKARCVVLANPVQSSGDSRLRGNDSSDGKFIFLYVGQIEKHKGTSLLLDAFSQIRKYNCILKIVGNGKESEKLKVKSSKLDINKIEFLGKRSSIEVRELMREANCLVVPSLCYENQPTVIIEAMQNKLPVIASNIGGIPEILDQKFLFKAGDGDDLVNKMKWIMENKNMPVETRDFISIEEYIDNLLEL